jgi:hypothetical protein
MNKVVSSVIITIEQHHHQHHATGTGNQSAFIPAIITRQQDPAIRLPNSTQQQTTTQDP